jgi:hypothetical protein
MSTTVQLIVAGVVFVGFVTVWLRARRRHRWPPFERLTPDATGAYIPQSDGTAVFVCSLCDSYSPASANQTFLRNWAGQHAADYHRKFVDLTAR